MPQFVIEREMPGAGSLSADDLKMDSQTSCSVLKDLGPSIQWVHSYVTDNKIYCIYRAPNEDLIREHAQRGVVLIGGHTEEPTGQTRCDQEGAADADPGHADPSRPLALAVGTDQKR